MKQLYNLSYTIFQTIFILAIATQLSAQTWGPTNGPLGGSARDIVLDSANTLFVGGPAGIFQSTTNADLWEKTTGEISTSFLTRMLVSADSNCLFVGTTNLGLYKSTDSGSSWENLNTELPASNIQDLTIGLDGTLIAGSNNGGVFRSGDNGATWEDLSSGLDDLRVFAAAQSNNGDLYAGTILTGIYRYSTTDTTWRPLSAGLGNLRCTWLMAHGADEMLAGTGGGVFKISAADTAWVKLGAVSPGPIFVTSLYLDNNQQLFASSLNGVHLYDSSNDTWTAMNNGISIMRTWRITQNAAGQYFLASDAGILRSDDNAASWTRQVNGFKASRVLSLLAVDNQTILSGNESSGIFRSINEGVDWEVSSMGLTSFAIRVMAQGPGDYIFAGISGVSGINRSTDLGQSWELVNNGFSGSSVQAITTTDAQVYAASNAGVFCSVDSGDTWQNLPNNGLTNTNIRALAVNSQGTIFAGTWNGGVFRFMENDTIWTEVNNGITRLFISALAIDDNGNLFAGTSGGGVFRSEDDGDNWVQINQGLTSTGVNVLSTQAAGTIYAGTSQGVFYSEDNGDNWMALNNGLSNLNIRSLLVRPNDILYAGTYGNGVYRIDLNQTSLDHTTDPLPAQFTLEQNYPNPFNPTTNIEFQIPPGGRSAFGSVELKVYDINGRLVKTLLNEPLSAGFHSVVWNGKNDNGQRVASGLYFYQLKAGEKFQQVRKMMLIR